MEVARLNKVVDLADRRREYMTRYMDGYEQGFIDARTQFQQRIKDLLALRPDQRKLYYDLVDDGFGDELAPIVVEMFREVERRGGS